MSHPTVSRWWLGAAIALTVTKIWLTIGQGIFAIGSAVHDDRLFVELAARLIHGEWLGPYTQFTLAKGPMYSIFMAAMFWLGLPLVFAQQSLYAVACAVFTRSLAPRVRTAGGQFGVYVLLLWNPMTFEAGNLTRIMRQNLYTPLALLALAGLVQLYLRRRESWRRQAGPALLAGFALGGFWLTREESVWLLPAVGLILSGIAVSLGRELWSRWRPLAGGVGTLVGAALLPVIVVCSLNLHYYGWFGTVEFRAPEFKAAYGALTRLEVGPELKQVPVTRQMREAAYAISPAFAQLRPYFEGPVGDHWSEKTLFPAAERQMRGGWFIWALRDAVAAAHLAPDARSAMRYYDRVAREINAACDAGRVAARPPRDGFLPPLGPELIKPLADAYADYGAFFLTFKGFTAKSPDSLGDYAELKPFRDLVGSRLSRAPRSLEPPRPTQDELDAWKVTLLGNIGRTLSLVFGILGPLGLLIGLIRGLESVADRRISFPLGLAGALLSACLAYLTINVLVHVTSFENRTVSAMAAAYPLYLAALAVIAVDAIAAWRRPVAAPVSLARPALSRWLWLLPAGTALVVFAARLREIHLYASDVPYNDQWIIEAEQIIGPWLAGNLHLTDFFRPHFEHLPVLTRLLSWLEVVVTGRWDPLVQMTVNAALHTGFIWLAARWAWRTLSVRSAGFVTAILLLGGGLPFAWENIAWGFQSQFPLALLFLFLHVHGAVTNPAGSRRWWLAQAAAMAGLCTLASMWLAPLAVVASLLWTNRRARREFAVPLAIAVFGFGLLLLIHSQQTREGSFTQVTASPLDFLHSFLHLLDWPAGLAGALAIVQLPWIIHAFRIRGESASPPLDRMIFALGLWSFAQAGALAFGRIGDTMDYVSRYGDLLFVGTFAGALALTRLAPASVHWRPVFFGGTLAWLALVVGGLCFHSTEGHARYFHQTAEKNAALRRTAVRNYLRNGDRRVLDAADTRWVLTQSTDLFARLLDRPDFRALLPHSVDPASPPDLAGRFSRALQARWWWLFLIGAGVIVVGGSVAATTGSSVRPPSLAPGHDRWLYRTALMAALASGGLLLIWDHPLTFDAEARWQEALGGHGAVEHLTFEFATPSSYGPERLQGAAPIRPIVLRNKFYGTAPAGPDFKGVVTSSSFNLTKPWLIVPYAGYPAADGNGLLLRLADQSGATTKLELRCPGPNREDIGFWPVDVHAFVGQRVQLVLEDGRTDNTGWVAIAPPIPDDTGKLAARLARRLQYESHSDLHTALGITSLVAFLCALVSWWGRRPR